MTTAEIKKIEDKIFPKFLGFLKKDASGRKKFNEKTFLDSARKMKESWKEKYADSDIGEE